MNKSEPPLLIYQLPQSGLYLHCELRGEFLLVIADFNYQKRQSLPLCCLLLLSQPPSSVWLLLYPSRHCARFSISDLWPHTPSKYCCFLLCSVMLFWHFFILSFFFQVFFNYYSYIFVKTFALAHNNIKSILLVTDVYIAVGQENAAKCFSLEKKHQKNLPQTELEESMSSWHLPNSSQANRPQRILVLVNTSTPLNPDKLSVDTWNIWWVPLE